MLRFVIQLIKKLFLYSNKKKKIDLEYEPKLVLKPSPNFSSRDGHKIDCIVIHHTGTHNVDQDVRWLTTKEYKDKDGKTKRNYASAHYVIGKNGLVYKLVKDQNKAWHAGYSYYDGRFNVNQFSIGIELVGNGNTSKFTNKQYKSLAWLCRRLINKHTIPRNRITSHSHIRTEFKVRRPKINAAPKYDPGDSFDWKRLEEDIRG